MRKSGTGNMNTSKFDEEYATLAAALEDGFLQYEDLKRRIKQTDKALPAEDAAEQENSDREGLLARYKALKREIHDAQVIIRERVLELRRDIKDHEEKLKELEERRSAGELSEKKFAELSQKPSGMIETKSLHVERLKKLVAAKKSADIVPDNGKQAQHDEPIKPKSRGRSFSILRITANLLTAAAGVLLIASVFFPFLSAQHASGTALMQITNQISDRHSLPAVLWGAFLLVAALNFGLCALKASRFRGFLHFLLFEAFFISLVWFSKDALGIIDEKIIGYVELDTFGIGAWMLALGLAVLLLVGLILMIRSMLLAACAGVILVLTGLASAGYHMNWFGLVGPILQISVHVEDAEVLGVPGQVLTATIANKGGKSMEILAQADLPMQNNERLLAFEVFDEESYQWKRQSADEWQLRLNSFVLFPVLIEPGESFTFERAFSPIWKKEPGDELTEDSEAGRYHLVLENPSRSKTMTAEFTISAIEHPDMKVKKQLHVAHELFAQRDYQGSLDLLIPLSENYPANPFKGKIQQLIQNCRDMLEKLARQEEGMEMLERATSLLDTGEVEQGKRLLREIILTLQGLPVADSASDRLSRILENEAQALLQRAMTLEQKGADKQAAELFERISREYPETDSANKAKEYAQIVQKRIDESVAADKLTSAKQFLAQGFAARARLLLHEIEQRYSHTSSYSEAHRLASIERLKEEFLKRYRCSGFITVSEKAGVVVRELSDEKRLLRVLVGENAGEYAVKAVDRDRRLVIMEKDGVQFEMNVR